MKNSDSIQLIKEQLKIKSIKLRQVEEEHGKITKKIKSLITFNQTEVKKLKAVIGKKDEEILEKESEVVAARMAKHVASGPKEEENAAAPAQSADPELIKKIDELRSRTERLRERIQGEKESNKKFLREKDLLLKELKRLRNDTGKVDILKDRIEELKQEVTMAKKSSMGTGAITQELVGEKDALIKKYEGMLYGNMDAGEDGMTPSEIIQELKEDVDELEKERRNLVVEMEMLREDNSEIEMKLTLLEEKEGSGGGGGEGQAYAEGGRSAATAEFAGGLEAFLITYADMITLLLVIFILMYTVSELDAERFAEAMSSFQEKRMRIESVNVRLNKNEMKMLERVRELVKDNVDAESLVRSDTRTIQFHIPTSDLFAPGSADLIEGADKLILETIEEEMKEGVKQVLIDGHTDNVPMNSPIFPSNWELSAARASRVGRFIIDTMRFPANQLVVSGYGQYRPLKPNTSDDNRALNRRVEVKILKDKKVAAEEDAAKKAAKTGSPPASPGTAAGTAPASAGIQ